MSSWKYFERSSPEKAGPEHHPEVPAARCPWTLTEQLPSIHMNEVDAFPTLFTIDEISALTLWRAYQVTALIPFCSQRAFKTKLSIHATLGEESSVLKYFIK